LSLKVLYDGDRFEAATITRLLEHLRTLFGGMVAQPEQRLAELPLLPEAERQQVVVEWNHPERLSTGALCPPTV
jgi:Non-ribosomal peptide synthetase modules and related proteins